GRGSSRSTSVPAGNGTFEVLQGGGHRVSSVRAIGSRNKAGAARRSSHFGGCRTSRQDAGTGPAGLGGATWHGVAYYTQDCSPRPGEFRHLRPSGRRVRRNQSDSDPTEVQ